MIKVILGRIGVALAAAAVFATCAAIVMVALAFALFAWVQPMVGPAWSGAVVAGAAALVMIVIGGTLAVLARPKPPKVVPRGGDPLARIVNLLKDVPLTAVAAAVATGFLAIRNPKYLGAAIRSFLEGQPAPPKRKR